MSGGLKPGGTPPTITASQITDSTATGRSVLTGTAAAGRDALAAVRRGSHVADASALPTPTADLLGAQYLLTGGVDGLGVPLLATCVTDDGVAYGWGLVPFGGDVAGLRTALGLTTLASLAIGTAGQRARVNAAASSGEWADPDLLCTAAELATTYAPSAALRGVIAYTTDTLSTYVCRRTAASTYAWLLIDYPQITEPTTQPLLRYKLDEAVGATTVVNSGSASSANLTLTGSAYAFGVATGLPYGLRCYPTASNYATGATAVQPAYPITVRAWLYCIGFTVNYAKVLYKAYNAAAWSAPEGNGLTFPAGLTGAIEGHITVGGTRRTVVCSGTGRYLIPGQWNLVALTYDGATMELSINGISVGTTAQAGAIDYGAGTARDWMLAGNYRVGGAAEPLDGMIAEACVDGSVIPLATLRQWYLRGVRRAS